VVTYGLTTSEVQLIGYDGNAGVTEPGTPEVRADVTILGNIDAHYDVTVSVDDFCTVTP
jgi:hypothetical protein